MRLLCNNMQHTVMATDNRITISKHPNLYTLGEEMVYNGAQLSVWPSNMYYSCIAMPMSYTQHSDPKYNVYIIHALHDAPDRIRLYKAPTLCDLLIPSYLCQ